MKVFYSWQSDVHPRACRSFIKLALERAVASVGEALQLEQADRPEVDEATKGTVGMVDIAGVILAKIAASAVYVADVTPVVRSPKGRAFPNPNVVFELGWACAKPGYERVIAVMNTVDGYQPEDLPFDIRNRRVIPYRLADDATSAERQAELSRFADQLTAAIRTNLEAHVAEKSKDVPIPSVPRDSLNPARWSPAPITILSRSGRQQTLIVRARPLGYLRFKTAGWPNAAPSPQLFLRLPEDQKPELMSPHTNSHDTALAAFGAVRFWIYESAKDRFQSNDLAAYFEELGEIWTLIGCVHRRDIGEVLHLSHLLAGWRNALNASNSFMNAHGARFPREAEAGIVGIGGAWLATNSYDASQCVKPDVSLSRRDNRWDEATQNEFCLDLYNRLRAAFGLDPQSLAEMQTLQSSHVH